MAENVKYKFIQNVGDYFPSGYFSEDFIDKVQKASGLNSDQMTELCKPYVKLRGEYEKYKNYILNTHPRVKDAIKHTHDFHTLLLNILGYDTTCAYQQFIIINEDDHSVVPVRHILTRNGKTTMLVMEMQHLIKTDEQEPAGLFEQHIMWWKMDRLPLLPSATSSTMPVNGANSSHCLKTKRLISLLPSSTRR